MAHQGKGCQERQANKLTDLRPERTEFDSLPRVVWVERDDYVRSVDLAMIEFLRAVKRVAPEVLSSLARDVLPRYQSLYLSGNAFERDYLINGQFALEVTRGISPIGRAPLAYLPEDSFIDRPDAHPFWRLTRTVYRWARDFHLDGRILRFAVQTLKAWNESGATQDFDWDYCLEYPVVVDPRLDFFFEFTQWQPDSDSWPSYKKKLDKALSHAQREYRTQMERIPNPERRTTGKHTSEHFEWLVHYQVKQIEYEEIYERYKRACNVSSVRSVSKAVRETAILVSLTLRSTRRKPGRPPKSLTRQKLAHPLSHSKHQT